MGCHIFLKHCMADCFVGSCLPFHPRTIVTAGVPRRGPNSILSIPYTCIGSVWPKREVRLPRKFGGGAHPRPIHSSNLSFGFLWLGVPRFTAGDFGYLQLVSREALGFLAGDGSKPQSNSCMRQGKQRQLQMHSRVLNSQLALISKGPAATWSNHAPMPATHHRGNELPPAHTLG